jgi:hypothetical protein
MRGVAGYNYISQFAAPTGSSSADDIDASRLVRAGIEQRRPGSTTNLDWTPVNDPIILRHTATDASGVSRWEGHFPPPQTDPAFEYRLSIEEFELHQTDESQAEYWIESQRLLGRDWLTNTQDNLWRTPVRGRLVYADCFALAPDRAGRLVPGPAPA